MKLMHTYWAILHNKQENKQTQANTEHPWQK